MSTFFNLMYNLDICVSNLDIHMSRLYIRLVQYVGEADRRLKDRFVEHQGYVRNKHLDKATGAHFNEKGHHLSDMRITILEQISNPDPFFRKQREHMYINLYNTKSKGLNRVS